MTKTLCSGMRWSRSRAETVSLVRSLSSPRQETIIESFAPTANEATTWREVRKQRKPQWLSRIIESYFSGMSMTNATLECYRRKRLDGPHEVEITAYNFYDCLEECTRRYSRNCKSVEFSSSQRLCRFSSGDMNDMVQTNLVDDPSYDYYKFLWRE